MARFRHAITGGAAAPHERRRRAQTTICRHKIDMP
ncbi:hypothetical protein M2260_000124 [Rhodococcus erythropolis]|nr:hypothetical protein [Rhodococcus erythropolis]